MIVNHGIEFAYIKATNLWIDVMIELIVTALGLCLIPIMIAYFWYLIKSIIVLFQYSNLWCILGIIAAIFGIYPFLALLFYFTYEIDDDKIIFKRYFLATGLMVILGIGAAIIIPTLSKNQSIPNTFVAKSTNTTPPSNATTTLPEKQVLTQEAYTFQKSPKLLALEAELERAKVQYAKKQAYDKANKKHAEQLAHQARLERDYQTYTQNQKARTLAEFNQAAKEYQRFLETSQSRYSLPRPTQSNRHTKKPQQVSQAMSDYCSKPVAGAHGMTAKQMEICSGISRRSSSSTPTPTPISNNPSPSITTNCDGAGCWGNNGTRYNSAGGGNYYSQDGRFCQDIGGQIQCH